MHIQSPFGKSAALVQSRRTMIRFLHTRIRVQNLDAWIAKLRGEQVQGVQRLPE